MPRRSVFACARRRGEDFDRLTYATVEILTLDPLPCWSGLPLQKGAARIVAFQGGLRAG